TSSVNVVLVIANAGDATEENVIVEATAVELVTSGHGRGSTSTPGTPAPGVSPQIVDLRVGTLVAGASRYVVLPGIAVAGSHEYRLTVTAGIGQPGAITESSTDTFVIEIA
ncbi:MAG TPA: hypothetical protein VGS21_09850, partial [Acidimicrobiales bacterium]|nr:hypothetical protein [Acidimicrobiales bacterium]